MRLAFLVELVGFVLALSEGPEWGLEIVGWVGLVEQAY